MKILLIDDLRTPSFILKHYGYTVTDIATSYQTGIRQLENEQFDLLLLDHDIASWVDGIERTGYHVLCWLEENPQHLPKKIVLVTSNPVGQQRMKDLIARLYGTSADNR